MLTIFGTSVYGGAVIATSLDYFFERMMMLKWVSKIEGVFTNKISCIEVDPVKVTLCPFSLIKG